ncbi:MAG: DUF5115 domain-containing protein [Prevotella sp.]|nr:DUF5115 domain-containing protein [Prevotella sp.]
MKKNILLGGMLLCAAAFTSCNEDFKDWADPQSNPQGDPAAAYGITVAPGSQANVVMDNATEMSQIIAVSADQPEVSLIVLKDVTISGKKLPYTYENNIISVKSAQLDSLVEAVTLDRSATPHAVAVKADWSAVLATGEAVPFESETEISVTPYSNIPEVDPKGYAMLGQWQGWDPSNPTWMTEVEPGVYQALVTTTDAGDNWYKFYMGSGFDAASFPWDDVALGCAENGDATSPNLLVWKDDPRFGKFETPVISGAGEWLITLDMNKLYFKYEPKETKYYVVGVPNGWSTENKTCLMYALGANKFSYTTSWNSQWSMKFWSEEHFGDWNAAFGGENGSTAATGSLIFGGDADGCGAIGPSDSQVWAVFTADMGSRTYEWTIIDAPTAEYNAISVIGGFNEWKDEGEIELTQLESAPHNWYARATIAQDTELKFRANHNWDVNWGGDGSAAISKDKYYVTPGGDNIVVPAGTYDFFLNDITGNWSIAWVAE